MKFCQSPFDYPYLLGTDHEKSDGWRGLVKEQKKFKQGKIPEKKIRAQKKVKKKKFMQKEGRIVTFI